MHRFTLLLAAIAAATLAAGCFGTASYSASVSSDSYGPDLVYAAPGVQVIADYDEPIFFADRLYWRFDGVRWYRSFSYTGGWVYATPPAVVLRIGRPHDFVHYRPQGWVDRRARARPQGPVARDHRAEPPRVERKQPNPAPPPHAAPPRHDAPPASKDRDHRPSPKDDDQHDGHPEGR